MAAASFTRLLLVLILFVLFSSCCSCSEIYWQCNGTEIRLPFYADVPDGHCRGHFLVRCAGDRENVLQIQLLDDYWYAIQSISYHDHILVIRDEDPPPDFNEEGYIYNFTEPMDIIHHPSRLKSLEERGPLYRCNEPDGHCLCDVFGHLQDSCTTCVNYRIFYASAFESHRRVHENCSSSSYEKTSFYEWRMLFKESGDLFLLSAGFSSGSMVLRPDCFEHSATGESICINSEVREGQKMYIKAIAIGVAAASGFFLICAALLFYRKQQLMHELCSTTYSTASNKTQKIEALLEENRYLSPVRYKYSDIRRITKSFHEKLGQGGCGTVYRGTLQDGRLVAVKMLSSSKGNGEEFINEVASIGGTSHVNIVRLLGFCMHGQERALVYEFMSNGSLDKFICSHEQRMNLGWKRLQDIAVGIARGLEYLHRGCNTRIVHFDIKPHNILLDGEFCPKISDFGLAKLCPPRATLFSMMNARGTIGYIAPEIFYRNLGVASTKSDVYSYGMVILEMAGTRKDPTAGDGNSSEAYFPQWIFKQLEQDGDSQAFDIAIENSEIAKKLMLVGLWCIQTIPAYRPSIRKVIEMLEGKMDDIKLPPQPIYPSPRLLSALNSSS